MTNSLPNSPEEEQRHERQYDYLLNKPFGLEELWKVLEKIRAKFAANQKVD